MKLGKLEPALLDHVSNASDMRTLSARATGSVQRRRDVAKIIVASNA